MKLTYILLIFLFIGNVCFGQNDLIEKIRNGGNYNDSAIRYVFYKSDSFRIFYRFDNTFWSEPMVGIVITDSAGNYDEKAVNEYYRQNRHYFAEVTISLIKRGKLIKSWLPISTTYVPAGCFEDVPEGYVKQALNDKKP